MSARDNDDDEIIAAAREGFLEEAQDNLRQFEAALLVMETDPDDAENLNAAFRAAHTIKGGAGLFGCTAVVAFTHEAETLLEALRSGQHPMSEHTVALLLQSRDMIGKLLDEVHSGESDPDVARDAAALGGQLRAVTQGAGAASQVASQQAVSGGSVSGGSSDEGLWHISLRFGQDALRNGLDPISFIRYLGKLGTVRELVTVSETVPELMALDAESCYLGFEISFFGDVSRADLDQVFEFVVEDCDIQILAPDASPQECAALREKRGTSDAMRELMDRLVPERVHEFKAAESGAQAGPVELEEVSPERRAGGVERRSGARRGDDAKFIRVRADKLDQLVDLIGELVIASSGAKLVAQREDSPDFMEIAMRIGDLVEGARDGALGLRMVPIGETFGRFQRVVRDVSKSLGKEVDLELTGGDTELDKAMVETIADPLTHLVRNSLDHGLETTEGRIAAGKPPRGRIALNAYHEGGQIVIEVSDDGRGVNREKVLAKAKEKGLVAADAQPSDAEIDQLICAPGFSTADFVTDISGRGVGMDVVKRNVDSLRGTMQIVSSPGVGTTIQIRLPLTLAIIDGFLTQVGQVHYVLPLDVMVECIETPASCRVSNTDVSGVFDLRGEVLPYVDIRRAFGHAGEAPSRQSMVVVRSNRTKVGLLVDRLLGEHQTVIKPLGAVFKHLQGIAGSTILGSGEVGLILEVPTLLQTISRPMAHPPPLGKPPGQAAQAVLTSSHH
jgi:two-component system chemotaxis sensor kinase CheA